MNSERFHIIFESKYIKIANNKHNGLFRCLGLFRQFFLFLFSLPFSWLSRQKSIIDQPPGQLDIKQSNMYRDILS